MPTLEVCLSPALFQHRLSTGPHLTVVVDILRASSSICTALYHGAEKIIPVPSVEQAATYVGHDFLIAGERDGTKLEIADLGNSPFQFSKDKVAGKSIVLTTTNGTLCIDMAKESGTTLIGAFSNFKVLSQWLGKNQENLLIFCAGWKKKFNLEDTVFAGALAEILIRDYGYENICDAASAAIDLWSIARNDLPAYIQKALHHQRLSLMGFEDVIPYCLTMDTAPVIPVLIQNEIRPLNPSNPNFA